MNKLTTADLSWERIIVTFLYYSHCSKHISARGMKQKLLTDFFINLTWFYLMFDLTNVLCRKKTPHLLLTPGSILTRTEILFYIKRSKSHFLIFSKCSFPLWFHWHVFLCVYTHRSFFWVDAPHTAGNTHKCSISSCLSNICKNYSAKLF